MDIYIPGEYELHTSDETMDVTFDHHSDRCNITPGTVVVGAAEILAERKKDHD